MARVLATPALDVQQRTARMNMTGIYRRVDANIWGIF